jgi:capsular polysaccharide biosynthesis protein
LDFWDITKLLVRQWRIALPLLALSAVLTVVTVSQVKPDYIAIAYVQLVPPSSGSTEPGAITADQQNQWIGQGLQTLGNAAIVQTMDQTVIDEFKTLGFSQTFTVTMGQSTPLVTVEVTGKSKAQAKETADALVAKFTGSVEQLQKANGVAKPSVMITAKRLDAGGNVKKSTSKIKRALVAVTAAGILLSAGATIAIDAWLRRRKNILKANAEAEDTAATSPIHARVGAGRSTERHVPIITGADQHGLTVEYQRPGPGDKTERRGDETAIIVPMSDAESTVVIPLAAMPPRPATAKRGKSS